MRELIVIRSWAAILLCICLTTVCCSAACRLEGTEDGTDIDAPDNTAAAPTLRRHCPMTPRNLRLRLFSSPGGTWNNRCLRPH